MKYKIQSEEEYLVALQRLEELMDVEEESPLLTELLELSILVENYEKETYPIEPPDPLEVTKFRQDQNGNLPDDQK